MKWKFKVGDSVNKVSGYRFPAVVVARFKTSKGAHRYVCEMKRYGLLHIFNGEQLKKSR
jgi:hypothetical protein